MLTDGQSKTPKLQLSWFDLIWLIVRLYFLLQEKLTKEFQESDLPSALKNFEKLLQANEGGHGFFVGKKVHVPPVICQV